MTKSQIRNLTPRQILAWLADSMERTIHQAQKLRTTAQAWNETHPGERPLTLDGVGAATVVQATRDEKLLPRIRYVLTATAGCDDDNPAGHPGETTSSMADAYAGGCGRFRRQRRSRAGDNPLLRTA